MVKEKSSFILYTDSKNLIDIMTNEQAGALLKAIFSYETGEPIPELDQVTMVAFTAIKMYLDRDKEKYLETCQKRAEAGRRGGRPRKEDIKANGFEEKAKKANGFLEKQTKAKKADSDSDSDNDSDSDSEINIKKPVRHKYGDYQNVLLTDEELEEIKAEFPSDWEERINVLSSYVASTGKKYKNIIATLRNWAKNEQKRKKGAYDDVPEQRLGYKTDDFF